MNYRRVFSLVAGVCLILGSSLKAEVDIPEPVTLLDTGIYIPDITTFMQIGYATPAGFNWADGTVFFNSSMSGAPQVYRLTSEGWPYQLTTFEDGIDFFSLSWGGRMAIVGASVGGSEDAQLYLMDCQTGRTLQLTNQSQTRYGSVVWAKDDRSILYRSNEENGRDFFLYRMNLATGEYHKLFGDTAGVRGYLAIADISQDGNYLIVSNWSSNVNDDLYMVNLSDGSYRQLNQDTMDVVYVSSTLMPDNKTIWLLCNGNEDGMMRLAKMKVGSPQVRFIDDGWLDPHSEVDDLVFSRDYKYMTVLVNEDGYMRMRSRFVESREELPSPPLDGQLGGGTFAADGSCLISFNGPTRAPDVWKWNPGTKELTQLTHSIYAGIDRSIFSAPQLVRFKSFDGLEIPAFLYLPPGYQPGTPIPFIVHAHGGPESQFKPAFIRNFQYLILHGYGILAVNPRGSSGYGREYMSLDNYKNRKNSLKDYKAAVDWLISKNYTAPGMIGIRGGSYGGYVVLGMITEYPELFSAAIDAVGIANFKTFLEKTRPYRRALREAEYGPLSDPEFLEQISPINKVDRIRTPLLVIHGENDPRVPIEEARQIIAGIQKNGGVVDSLIFPDEGHGVSKRVNIIREYRKQIEFFGRYLKGSKR